MRIRTCIPNPFREGVEEKPHPAPPNEVLHLLSVVFLLLQRGRAQRFLCMTLCPYKPWWEALDRFKPSLFGINGLGNSVFLPIRVIHPALIADLFCFSFPSEASWPCDLSYMTRPVMCLAAETPPPSWDFHTRLVGDSSYQEHQMTDAVRVFRIFGPIH